MWRRDYGPLDHRRVLSSVELVEFEEEISQVFSFDVRRSNVGRYFSSIDNEDEEGDFDNVHGQQRKYVFLDDFFDEVEDVFPIVKSRTYLHLKEDVMRKIKQLTVYPCQKERRSMCMCVYVRRTRKNISPLFVTRFIGNYTNLN